MAMLQNIHIICTWLDHKYQFQITFITESCHRIATTYRVGQIKSLICKKLPTPSPCDELSSMTNAIKRGSYGMRSNKLIVFKQIPYRDARPADDLVCHPKTLKCITGRNLFIALSCIIPIRQYNFYMWQKLQLLSSK